MTVSYAAKISTAKVGVFSKLLFAWTGSVYKLVWFEFVVYFSMYFCISLFYRFGLTEEQQKIFEDISIFCEKHSPLIPLTFVLAFYVSHVVSRWWDQYNAIPWPDAVAFKVNAFCRAGDKVHTDEVRSLRRNVIRYTCAAIVETLRMVSCKVKKRFPTMHHLVDAGLLTEKEVLIMEAAQKKSEYLEYKYWVPLYWASNLINVAHEKKYIAQSKFVVDIHDELSKVRGQCGMILSYDWISFPLVYTQVVTLALNFYFGAALIGRQYLNPEKNIPGVGADYFFPVFTFLQFFFYNGWLKVAEALLNPFGEDDEDFDTNWMVDRNIQLSYIMVDEVGRHPPEFEKDPFWNIGIPLELPYTVASLDVRGARQLETGAFNLDVPIDLQETVDPSTLEEYFENGNVRNEFSRRFSLVVDEVFSWASTPISDRKIGNNLGRENSQKSRLSIFSGRRRTSTGNRRSIRSESIKSFDSFVNTPSQSPSSHRKVSLAESRKHSTITTCSGLETVLEGKEAESGKEASNDYFTPPKLPKPERIEIIITEPDDEEIE